MGKLYLGEMTEIAQRVKNVENTPVIKLMHDLANAEGDINTDVMVVTDGFVGEKDNTSDSDSTQGSSDTSSSDFGCGCGNQDN